MLKLADHLELLGRLFLQWDSLQRTMLLLQDHRWGTLVPGCRGERSREETKDATWFNRFDFKVSS
jgi:hypothetical protein